MASILPRRGRAACVHIRRYLSSSSSSSSGGSASGKDGDGKPEDEAGRSKEGGAKRDESTPSSAAPREGAPPSKVQADNLHERLSIGSASPSPSADGEGEAGARKAATEDGKSAAGGAASPTSASERERRRRQELASWSSSIFNRGDSRRSSPPERGGGAQPWKGGTAPRREGGDRADETAREGAAASGEQEMHAMFSEEHTKHLSQSDLEDMMTVYDLLKKHVQRLSQDPGGLSLAQNPLFDEMDFPVRRLPRLPKEILNAYKKEIKLADTELQPYIGSHLNALERSEEDEPSAERSVWIEVDRRTASEGTRGALRRRERDSGPPTMRSSSLLNPDPIPAEEPPCRIRASNPDHSPYVDFRQVGVLDEFVSEAGHILPNSESKLSPEAQKSVAQGVKRARTLALLCSTKKVSIPPINDLAAKTLIQDVIGELDTTFRDEQRARRRVARRKARASENK